MNNKAFTLIELTAVIVVLAAIFLVSFPSLLNMAKKDDNEKYYNMIKNLCLAGETYIYNNNDSFEGLSTVGTKIQISINELITYGAVSKDMINPKTNKTIKNDHIIYTVLSNYSLECEYKES